MANGRLDAFILGVPTSAIDLFSMLVITRIFQTTQALKNSVKFLHKTGIEASTTFQTGVDII